MAVPASFAQSNSVLGRPLDMTMPPAEVLGTSPFAAEDAPSPLEL
jgi:hypothetical protein